MRLDLAKVEVSISWLYELEINTRMSTINFLRKKKKEKRSLNKRKRREEKRSLRSVIFLNMNLYYSFLFLFAWMSIEFNIKKKKKVFTIITQKYGYIIYTCITIVTLFTNL